ncbi:DUF1127 domain-containing protein [Aestuariivirga sp.]|uniref:DUF1127 domain-containing protein n=1 Tax=Aestuariivirga sp. TaxID=2650926 RepID=UPI003BA8505B
MTLETFGSTRPLARPGNTFRPLQAFAALFTAWQERRRAKADLALLMSMDPHVLQDIGVTLVHTPYDNGSIISHHPAVIATTMAPRRNRR